MRKKKDLVVVPSKENAKLKSENAQRASGETFQGKFKVKDLKAVGGKR